MRRAFYKTLFAASFLIGLLPVLAFAQDAPAAAQQPVDTANPVVLIIIIGALALAPFGLIMMTSFVKIAVVLSILRNALGTQQVPPNQVITGIALILTIFIMSPVAEKMYAEAGTIDNTEAIFSEVSVKTLFEASKKAKEPLAAIYDSLYGRTLPCPFPRSRPTDGGEKRQRSERDKRRRFPRRHSVFRHRSTNRSVSDRLYFVRAVFDN